MAAIKAVNESMQSSGQAGSVTVLRGLWKVFDAAMSELGMELNDSLSNKAIFEGKIKCVLCVHILCHHLLTHSVIASADYFLSWQRSKCHAREHG